MRSIFTLLPYRSVLLLLFFSGSLLRLNGQTHTPKTVSINAACGGYYEYLPVNYSTTTGKYPVLIYISGGNAAMGNGTTSSMAILLNQGVPRVINQNLLPTTFTVNGETTSYIIISPQFRYKPSPAEVNSFIDYIVNAYPRIDRSRICLTGFSIGGDVAWKTPYDLTTASRLAALVPVAGYNNPYSDTNAQYIAAAKLPVWAIHSNDDAAPVSWTVGMVNKINSYKPAVLPVLTRPNGLTHEETHVVVYEPTYKPNGLNIYEWCLQFKRSTTTNNAPLANAGADKSITLPANSITLTGSGSDADGGTLTYRWTKISGPAAYAISNPTAASTAVTGLTAGEYQFQLEVTDPEGLTGKDIAKVTVLNPPNQLPVAKAGEDQTITLPVNSVSLSGASSSDADGTIASYQWSQVAGPSASTLANATTVTATASNLVSGTYSFELLIKDNSGATGKDTVNVIVNPSAGLVKRILKVNIYGGSNPAGSGWNNWNVQSSLSLSNTKYVDGTSSGITATLNASNAVADNGATYPVTMCPVEVGRTTSYSTIARSIVLSGLDNTKKYELEVYSSRGGSGNTTKFTIGSTSINILSSNNYSNKAVFTNITPGAGQVKLTIERLNTYNYINGFILTEIGSEPARPDQAPVAAAGADQQIQLPANSVQLNGNGSADSDGNIASYQWTKVSGPAQFTISNAGIVNPVVNNLVAGVYVFELLVTDDKGATDKDSVTVTVNAAANQLPVANAGSNQSINLPSNTVSLNGSASSDADGSIASFQWKQVSGPSTAVLNNATSAIASASNLIEGLYNFELLVKDNNNEEAKDTVVITVNAPLLSEKIIKVNVYGGSNPAGTEWNNWNVQSSLTLSNMKYSDGSASTVTATLNLSNAIADNGANYPVTMCPAEVGRTTSYSTVGRYIILSGLDDTKQYELEVYGSRNGTGNTTRYTVGSTSINILTDRNYANKAVFSNLSSSSGQIRLTIDRLNTYNYINGFILKESGSANGLMTARNSVMQTTATTATDEPVSKGELGTYPNPFNDNIDLQVNNDKSGTLKVVLINQHGKPVKFLQFVKEQGLFRKSISLQDLQPGVYFLQVQMTGWSKSEKVVKM